MKIPFTPWDWQKVAHKHMKRFTVIVCHRRAGKTYFDVIQSIGEMLSCKFKNPQAGYFGPTRDQVKKTAWKNYKEFLKPLYDAGKVTYNESDLSIAIKRGPGDVAMIYLYSYENVDNIRGNYLDHAVLDEFQLGDSNIFERVVKPMLGGKVMYNGKMVPRQGKAIITGTPKGRNYFYELYQKGLEDDNPNWNSMMYTVLDTDVIPEQDIEEEKRNSSEESFNQEFMCSFDAATKGAYYGNNIARLRAEGRIVEGNHDPMYPVVTAWDIGFDGTSVWYCQKVARELRIIDFDFFDNKDLPHCVNVVINKPYTYVVQLLPHDAKKRSILDKRKTAKGQIESLGLKCKIVPREEIQNGIHATRILLDKVLFLKKCDKKVKIGRAKMSPIDSLSLYRAEYDESKGVNQQIPVHDVHSHVADALRTLAMGIKDSTFRKTPSNKYNQPGKPDTTLIQNKWNPLRRNRPHGRRV